MTTLEERVNFIEANVNHLFLVTIYMYIFIYKTQVFYSLTSTCVCVPNYFKLEKLNGDLSFFDL